MYIYVYIHIYYIYVVDECVICQASVYMFICTFLYMVGQCVICRRVCEGLRSIDETLAKQNVCEMMRVIHMCTYMFANMCKHTATHCNTLQHTATHCNTLQHTVGTSI